MRATALQMACAQHRHTAIHSKRLTLTARRNALMQTLMVLLHKETAAARLTAMTMIQAHIQEQTILRAMELTITATAMLMKDTFLM